MSPLFPLSTRDTLTISMRSDPCLVWILSAFLVLRFYFVYEMLKMLSNTDTNRKHCDQNNMLNPLMRYTTGKKILYYYDYEETNSKYDSTVALSSRHSKSLLTWLTMALHTASSWGGGGGDLASCFMTVSGKRSSHKRLSAISSGTHTFVGCWWN